MSSMSLLGGSPTLGSEVDKVFKILIKTSNVMEYVKLDIQNIETPRIDDPMI